MDERINLTGFELPKLQIATNIRKDGMGYEYSTIKNQTYSGCFRGVKSKNFKINKNNLEIFKKMKLLSGKVDSINTELIGLTKQLTEEL